MRLHRLMASAAVLAFATGAIAQDAAAPAVPDSATTPAPADTAAPDAAASTGAAANTAASTTDTTTAAAPTDQSTTTAAAPTDQSTTTAAAPAPADAASAAAAPASDAASAAAMPAQSGADTQSATNATAAAPAVDPAKAQAAEQMVAQNWSKYDAGNKGQLTPLEFGNWVMAAQGNDMTAQVEKSRQSKAANLPSTKVLNATAAEFSKADTNKDHQVSQDELKAYLAG